MGEAGFSFTSPTVQAAGRKGALGRSLCTVSPGDAEAWVWLAYDQLNAAFLESLDLNNIGVVLIESSSKAKRRPLPSTKIGRALGQSASFCA